MQEFTLKSNCKNIW